MLYILTAVGIMALITFLLRGLPFLIFTDKKHTPESIVYLGQVLPPAIIGMLVIYCLKDCRLHNVYFLPPEILAGISVVVLQCWKRNILLSITLGTLVNMFLWQVF